jgi:hypothetical protein
MAVGEAHAGNYILAAGAGQDDRRPLVDEAVPDLPRLVIAAV